MFAEEYVGEDDNVLGTEATAQKKKRRRPKRKSKGKDASVASNDACAPAESTGLLDIEAPSGVSVAAATASSVEIVGAPRFLEGSETRADAKTELKPDTVLAKSLLGAVAKAANMDTAPAEHGDIERQALILVEKEVVLARVRDHQNFSCSCNVCTRKREAIENELDYLYDCYYEELKESVRREKMRSLIRTAEKRARSIILSSVEAIADSMASKLVVDPQCGTKETVHKTIMDIIRRRQATAAHASGQVPDGLSVFDSAIEVAASAASESVLAKIASAAQCLPEDLAYCKTIESLGSSDLRDSMELTSIERASSAIK
ncbi:Stress response protein nst1, partial [Coemansia sp. RSA 2673]